MVSQGLETNCQNCPFRTYDGTDHICMAYLDQHEGKVVVRPDAYNHPDWCPLEQPQRITRAEIENSLHPTVRVALQNMHLNNGGVVPDSLLDTVEAGRSLPRGDR